MSKSNHRSHHGPRGGSILLALLLVPLLLILHAPLLAAIVPGALLTVASLDTLRLREQHASPSASVVGSEDHDDLRRIVTATSIQARTRRVD